MFRRLLIVGLVSLFGFAATSLKAQEQLRKLRIVSGTIEKVDYKEKNFVLSGIKGPNAPDDVELTVQRSTKGLEHVKEGAQVTVLYDELEQLAIRVRTSGEDAEGTSNLVEMPRDNSTSSTGLRPKPNPKKKTSSSTRTSMGPILPPVSLIDFNPDTQSMVVPYTGPRTSSTPLTPLAPTAPSTPATPAADAGTPGDTTIDLLSNAEGAPTEDPGNPGAEEEPPGDPADPGNPENEPPSTEPPVVGNPPTPESPPRPPSPPRNN